MTRNVDTHSPPMTRNVRHDAQRPQRPPRNVRPLRARHPFIGFKREKRQKGAAAAAAAAQRRAGWQLSLSLSKSPSPSLSPSPSPTRSRSPSPTPSPSSPPCSGLAHFRLYCPGCFHVRRPDLDRWWWWWWRRRWRRRWWRGGDQISEWIEKAVDGNGRKFWRLESLLSSVRC
jgi:hypothetical protein